MASDLAKNRLRYPAPVVGLPDMVLIDIPADARGPGLLMGRFYGIVVETAAEHVELEAFLAMVRDEPVCPDLLDRRPSAVETDQVLIIRYEPTFEDWPWLSLCRWSPTNIGVPNAGCGSLLARGCYSFEAFETPGELVDHQAALLASLADRHHLKVRLLSQNMIGSEGRA